MRVFINVVWSSLYDTFITALQRHISASSSETNNVQLCYKWNYNLFIDPATAGQLFVDVKANTTLKLKDVSSRNSFRMKLQNSE
jgi:hypothetical protein